MKYFFWGIKKGTKDFGENLSFLTNAFLFSLVYLIGVGVTSLFLKLGKKHVLDLNISSQKTYWEDLSMEKENENNYYNQF